MILRGPLEELKDNEKPNSDSSFKEKNGIECVVYATKILQNLMLSDFSPDYKSH